jgi:hypothetical protein
MAPRTKYDLDLFRKLITNGKTKVEIMAEMSIKNLPTFNGLKLKLMEADKKYYRVKESKSGVGEKIIRVNVGKRNTLSLSSKILDEGQFKPGDAFHIKMTKGRINLTLIEE